MKPKAKSQKRIIVEFLITGKQLTKETARQMISLKDPVRVISNLRKEGFDILTSGDNETYYIIPNQYLKANMILYKTLYPQ